MTLAKAADEWYEHEQRQRLRGLLRTLSARLKGDHWRNQPRDELGQWSETGGGGSSGGGGGGSAAAGGSGSMGGGGSGGGAAAGSASPSAAAVAAPAAPAVADEELLMAEEVSDEEAAAAGAIPEAEAIPEAVSPVDEQGRPQNVAVGNEARPDLLPDEEDALTDYSEEGSAKINKRLREGKPLQGSDELVHQSMQSAFAKTKPLANPVLVHRGMQVDKKQLAKLEAAITQAKTTGSLFQLPGYTSTTTGEIGGDFEGNVEIHIMANRGIDMMPHSVMPEEQELLLDHDTKFQPHGIRRTKHGKLIIQLRQV